MIIDWSLVGLAALTIVWTILPLLRHEAWWIRAFDFPRVQVLTVTAIVLLAFVSLVGWHSWSNIAVLASLLVCLGYQMSCIAPYTPAWPKQLKSATGSNADDTLSLLSANVFTPNRNAADLVSMIRCADPDVLLAIETDQWWQSKLDQLQSDYPYSVKHPLNNLYGMHLYSRLRLVEPKVMFLIEDDKPSIHAQVELRSGKRVQLHCLHPAPPSPSENETSQERDAELILVAKSLNDHDRPTVVVGDLNDVAWSATTRLFQKISGLLDPRIGRGMYNTFNAKYPFLRWPLDHIFCSSDFTLVSLSRLDFFGSDHFPIHAVLQHTPEAETQHDSPKADNADHAWADKKLDNISQLLE